MPPHSCALLHSKRRYFASDDHFQREDRKINQGPKSTSGCHHCTPEKGWMDGELMLKWLDGVWNKSCQFNQPGSESILIMDSFSTRLTNSVADNLKKNKVHTLIVPGGCTSILQPLDVSLKKPFKAILRQLWQEYMLQSTEELEKKRAEGDTPAFKIPPPSKQMMVDWVITAWLELAKKVDAVRSCLL